MGVVLGVATVGVVVFVGTVVARGVALRVGVGVASGGTGTALASRMIRGRAILPLCGTESHATTARLFPSFASSIE